MADISNKTLALLIVVAIMVSVVGILSVEEMPKMPKAAFSVIDLNISNDERYPIIQVIKNGNSVEGNNSFVLKGNETIEIRVMVNDSDSGNYTNLLSIVLKR